MAAETRTLHNILRRWGRGAVRLFRINVGQAWTGRQVVRGQGQTVTLRRGDILLRDAHPLRTGVPNGYADLTGWRSVEVTPDMVGRKLAVFSAIEVKSPRGRPTPEQVNFLRVVSDAGGFAGVARSVEEAGEILSQGLHRGA